MLKSFRSFSEDTVKPITVTFGRFNPPHNGHAKLLDAVVKYSAGGDYKIYASHSTDPKKNPLSYDAKIKFMRKMFPKMGRNIILDKKIRSVFDIAAAAHDAGYTKFVLVVGSDRVNEFRSLLTKYNGVKGRHGYYSFSKGIVIKSAGERDPDAEGLTGMSASKMRKAAAENDLKSFSKGLPKTFSNAIGLFNAVRIGMGLEESRNFRKHHEINTNAVRENYVAGTIFNVGDKICTTKDPHLHRIVARHTNFVTAKNIETNERTKFFINDISLIEN